MAISDNENQANNLRIDSQGFVYVEGVKICRVRDGVLFFLDKDKRRIARRGSDQVPVAIAAIVQLGISK